MNIEREARLVLAQALAKCKADVVECWSCEPDREKREALWHQLKATERLEEYVADELKRFIGGDTEQPRE